MTPSTNNRFSDFLLGMAQEFAGRVACMNVEPGLITASTAANMPPRYTGPALALGMIQALRNTQVASIYKIGQINLAAANSLILRVMHAVILQETNIWKQEQNSFKLNRHLMSEKDIAQKQALLAAREDEMLSFMPYFVGPDQKQLTHEEVLSFNLEYPWGPDFNPLVDTYHELADLQNNHRLLQTTYAELLSERDRLQDELAQSKASHAVTGAAHDDQVKRIQAAADHVTNARMEDLAFFSTLYGNAKIGWPEVREKSQHFLQMYRQIFAGYEENKAIRDNQFKELAELLHCTPHYSAIVDKVRSLANREVCGTCRNEREFKTADPRIKLPCPTCRPALAKEEPPAQPGVKTQETRDGTGKLVGVSVTTVNPPPLQNVSATLSADSLARGLGLADASEMERLRDETLPYYLSADIFDEARLKAARTIQSSAMYGIAPNPNPNHYAQQLFLLRYAAAYKAGGGVCVNRKRGHHSVSMACLPKPEIMAKYVNAIGETHQVSRLVQISADAATNLDNEFKTSYEIVAKAASRQEYGHDVLL